MQQSTFCDFFTFKTLIAMKKLVITGFSVFIFINSYCQNENIEREIRYVEEKRVAALRTSDTAALLKIWAPDYMVNRPAGVVSTRDKALELVLTDSLIFTSYEFEIEKILIKKDFVIVMGNDTVIPSGNNRNAGKTLKRRYTHIWTKENGNWRLFARHANILCQ